MLISVISAILPPPGHGSDPHDAFLGPAAYVGIYRLVSGLTVEKIDHASAFVV
jgi:hypothetical protein